MTSNISYGSTILIDFNMLVDLDTGLLRLINREYCDKNVFYKSVVSLDNHHLKGVLHESKSFNPLYVAMKNKEDVDYMDYLYSEFMNNRYEDIVNMSSATEICMLVKKFIDTEGIITPTILCNNYYQRKIAKDLIFKDCLESRFNIELSTTELYDVSKYTDIFVKDIRTLLKFKNLKGKNIYLANLNRNMNQEKLKETGEMQAPEAFNMSIFLFNELRFIELYQYDDSYYHIPGYYKSKFKEVDLQEESFDAKNNIFIKSMLGNIPDEFDNKDGQDEYKEEEDPYLNEPLIESNKGIEEDDFDPYAMFGIPKEDEVINKK